MPDVELSERVSSSGTKRPDGNGAAESAQAQPFFFSKVEIFCLVLYAFSTSVLHASQSGIINISYSLTGKISAATLAIVQTAIGVVNLYLSIFFNSYGDRLVTRFGRRKPMLAVGIVLEWVGASIICFPDESSVNLIGQVTIALFIYSIGSAVKGNSLNSWILEVCPTQREYVIVNAYMALGYVVGALPTLAAIYLGNGHLNEVTLTLFLTFTISYAISLPLLFWRVPSPLLESSPEQFGIVPSVRQCWRLKEFRILLSNQLLLQSAFAIANSAPGHTIIFICFGFKYVSQVYGIVKTIAGASVGGVIVGYVFVLQALARKWFDKLSLYQVATGVVTVAAVGAHLCFVPSIIAFDSAVSAGAYRSALTAFIIFGFIGGFFAVILGFFGDLLFRDVLKFDAFMFDLDRENMFQVAFNTPINIVTGVLSSFFGALLLATGLDIGSSDKKDALVADVYQWNQGTVIQIVMYGTGVVSILAFVAWTLLEYPPYPLKSKVAEQMSLCVDKRIEIKATRASEGSSAGAEVSIDTFTNNPLASAGGDGGGEGGASSKKADLIAAADAMRAKKNKILRLEDWNYFADAEILHIASMLGSGTTEESKDGLRNVGRMPKMGAYFAAPLTLVVLAVSIGGMYSYESHPPFALMIVALFQAVSFYQYYELGRVWAYERLMALPLADFMTGATDAREAIDKYSVSLQNLLDQHSIDDTLDNASPDLLRFTVTSPPETGLARRSSAGLRKTRTTIVDAPEVDSKDKLYGYKRIFCTLALIILFCVVVVSLGY